MVEVTLYEFDVSPFCEKTRRNLQVKGLRYRRVEMAAKTPAQVRRINPRGKFPVLRYGDHTVADSSEIAVFLEREVPEPRLFGDNPGERAFVRVLEDWADESLYWYEVYLRFLTPENAGRISRRIGSHLPAVVRPLAPYVLPRMLGAQARAQGIARKPRETVLAELEGHYAMLAQFLEGRPYLAGPRLTIADIAVSAQMWALIDGGQRGAIERWPELAAWYDRVTGETAPN